MTQSTEELAALKAELNTLIHSSLVVQLEAITLQKGDEGAYSDEAEEALYEFGEKIDAVREQIETLQEEMYDEDA